LGFDAIGGSAADVRERATRGGELRQTLDVEAAQIARKVRAIPELDEREIADDYADKAVVDDRRPRIIVQHLSDGTRFDHDAILKPHG
jgi:hypothetical protein